MSFFFTFSPYFEKICWYNDGSQRAEIFFWWQNVVTIFQKSSILTNDARMFIFRSMEDYSSKSIFAKKKFFSEQDFRTYSLPNIFLIFFLIILRCLFKPFLSLKVQKTRLLSLTKLFWVEMTITQGPLTCFRWIWEVENP